MRKKRLLREGLLIIAFLFVISPNVMAQIIVPSGFRAEVFATNLSDPFGLIFGPGGAFGTYLYVSHCNSGKISRVDSNGHVTTFVSGLSDASGMAFGPGGAFGSELFVAQEQVAGVVSKIDSTGNVTSFATGLTNACDIAFGPGGEWGTDLFVADPVEGKIYQLDSIGNVTNLYVGEVNISTISKVNSEGNKVHFASGFGGDPHVLVFGPGGVFGTDLYISNDWKGNILRVDSNGNFTVFASGFGRSAGIAFDPSGSLFVADEANNRIIKISPIDVEDTGNMITSDLWIRSVINTEEKGPIEAVWQKGGEDTTSRGDRVIWGHFYADPSDVTWGSSDNPDLFVKIWFDVSGRIDVNYFHVSVPDIEVYSDYPYDGTADEQGTTTMSRRYIRQYYENGQSHSEENYEDGNPPYGYSPAGNPSGFSTINDLRIGSIINTVEKGPIDAVWRFGGQDTTARGDQVVWGHFYANPSDVTWGSLDNPDLFVKIWFDASGRVDVNFFHVSVPDIEVYSALPDNSMYDQKGTTIMDNRYIRHEYWR
jgi:hypothetical protein